MAIPKWFQGWYTKHHLPCGLKSAQQAAWDAYQNGRKIEREESRIDGCAGCGGSLDDDENWCPTCNDSAYCQTCAESRGF